MLLVTIIVCFLEELVGTKEGKALILFYVCGFGKALFLVTRVYWLYIHVHTCLFLQKVNGCIHTVGTVHKQCLLCAFPVPAISFLFSPSSVCWCLSRTEAPRAQQKKCLRQFMVCSMACKSCKGSIHEQWSGKGHGHLNFSPRDGEKPKINDHAFLWIIFPIRVVKGDCDLHFVSLFSPFLRSDSFWDVCLFLVCRQNFARRQLISIS